MMGLSKNLVSFLALLLLCEFAVGNLERGQPLERRRTAVGERPSPAPSTSVEDDDSTTGKSKQKYGSKGMKANGSKGMKSEKGKGLKSSKSSKSSKSFEGLGDLDMSMSIPMSMPMSMSMELGKEMKMEKVSKSVKLEKGSKSTKHKKAKDDDDDNDVVIPSTPPPTSADSISQKSTPFVISYHPSTDVPLTKDYQELAIITQSYLMEYMKDFFEETSLTTLDTFLTIMVKNVFEKGIPVLAEYESNGLFSPDSIFVPTTREINNLVEDSILQEDYLEMVRSLPRSNPFHKTKKVVIKILDDEPATEPTEADSSNGGGSGSSESSSSVKAGVAAAAAGVVILAASLAMIRRTRPSDELEDDDDVVEDFSAHKVSYEDATYADEASCNMSVDDPSSHFAHFSRHRSEAGEFEDEPLDSVDECRKMVPSASFLS
mmetsp:Transcript_9652/g.28792  ORF Transcript_9652/g.28792 Transcript_9652/m.28792 type:complete len:432 (-) Transcript_9652:493-1788(-)